MLIANLQVCRVYLRESPDAREGHEPVADAAQLLEEAGAVRLPAHLDSVLRTMYRLRLRSALDDFPRPTE